MKQVVTRLNGEIAGSGIKFYATMQNLVIFKNTVSIGRKNRKEKKEKKKFFSLSLSLLFSFFFFLIYYYFFADVGHWQAMAENHSYC